MNAAFDGLREHERRTDRRRWHISLGLAGGLHLAAAAGLFSPPWLSEPVRPLPGMAPVAVELEPIDAAPVEPPTEVPQGQAQRAAVPERQTRTRTPKPKPVALPTNVDGHEPPRSDAAQPTPQPEPEPEPPQQMAQTETAVASRAAPEVNRVPTAPVEGTETGASDNPVQSWESQIVARLEKAKRYPSAARWQRQQDTVFVDIVLDRSGQVTSARIGASAGFAALDDEVLDLVRRVAPYPKAPDEVKGDHIALRVPVEFSIARR